MPANNHACSACRAHGALLHPRTAKRLNCSGEKFVRASRERGAVCGAPICPGSPGAIPDMSVGAVQGCTQRR